MRLILAISMVAAALVSPQQAVASAPAPTTSISQLGFVSASARKTQPRSELEGSAPRAVIRGQQVPVRGVLKPRRRGVQVKLQRREGPKWTTVNSGRTDKRSHFTITDRPLSGTSAVYRLTSTEATSPSPPMRVRLRSGSVAVPRRGTELLRPHDVVRITPAGVDQAVTFANRRAIPSVGSTIVVPPVPGAPEGWIGIVKASAKRQGKGVVIARDATLDDAYSDLTIALTAHGAVSTAQSTGSTLSRRGAPEVLCTIGGKPPRFDIRPRLDDWDIDLVLDRRSRTVRQSLSADVTVVTTMETAGGIECSVTLPLVEKPIYSIGYIPIIASLGPTANISATSGFSASGEVKLRLRETTTAQANRSTMTTSVTASSNRQSFTSRTSQTVSIGAGLQGSISVAKLVAFNLSLTGKVAADIQHGKQPDPCFVTSLMGNAETSFDGKSWGFLGWKFAISDHDFGRRPLGDGCQGGPGTTPTPTPTPTPTSPPPPALMSGPQSITAGESHSCALDTAGKAWCWGSNAEGQLGDGTSTDSTVPVAANTDGLSRDLTFSDIDAGGNQTCALDTSGKAYCWGAGRAKTPTPVLGGFSYSRVSVGGGGGADHACGLTQQGSVLCWGDNVWGSLGDGTQQESTTPVPVSTSGVLAGKRLVSVTAGAWHTCALDDSGSSYCWGFGHYGQLGNGKSSANGQFLFSSLPVVVDTERLRGKRIQILSAGGQGTCALDESGTPYCWGILNNDDPLSVGLSYFDKPTTLSNSWVFPADKTLVRIVAGGGQGAHSCGIDAAGKAYCWGNGYFGQLGNGQTGQSTCCGIDPATAVGGQAEGVKLTEVLPGSRHTCALDDQGIAYCWGSDHDGQLGDGSTHDTAVPVLVAGGHVWRHSVP